MGGMAEISERGVLRAGAMAAGLAGGLWGVAAALVALDVLPAAAVHPLEGRVGDAAGVATLVLALLGLAGAVMARRRPAWSCALLFTAGFAGFFSVGAGWLLPGLLLSAASCAALAAIENPFAEEIARDRELRRSRRADARRG
jgi:hypothetical protein